MIAELKVVEGLFVGMMKPSQTSKCEVNHWMFSFKSKNNNHMFLPWWLFQWEEHESSLSSCCTERYPLVLSLFCPLRLNVLWLKARLGSVLSRQRWLSLSQWFWRIYSADMKTGSKWGGAAFNCLLVHKCYQCWLLFDCYLNQQMKTELICLFKGTLNVIWQTFPFLPLKQIVEFV